MAFQVDPNLLTCINADGQDLQSQIRMTIRPLNAQSMGLHPLGMGFGGPMGPGGPGNQDHEQEWTVDGLLLPSQLVQKAGSYRVAIFSGGRTFGQCEMSALGQVLDTGSQNPMMSAMRMGPGSPFGMGMGMNPFRNMFGNRFQQEPNGLVSNSAFVSTGTTMYSGIVRGISYNQMVGRSIGVCQSVQGGQCYGLIPFCCSITRDALPASEVYVDPLEGAQQAGPLAFNQAGVIGVQGGTAVGFSAQSPLWARQIWNSRVTVHVGNEATISLFSPCKTSRLMQKNLSPNSRQIPAHGLTLSIQIRAVSNTAVSPISLGGCRQRMFASVLRDCRNATQKMPSNNTAFCLKTSKLHSIMQNSRTWMPDKFRSSSRACCAKALNARSQTGVESAPPLVKNQSDRSRPWFWDGKNRDGMRFLPKQTSGSLHYCRLRPGMKQGLRQYSTGAHKSLSQSALTVKRPLRKKLPRVPQEEVEHGDLVVAYAVAEELNLAQLKEALIVQGLYSISPLPIDAQDALHVQAKYTVDEKKREIFFFRDGSAVFWSMPDVERKEALKFIRKHDIGRYASNLILREKEEMDLKCIKGQTGVNGDTLQLSENEDEGQRTLEKYAFSNALAQSVKLAIWETSLEGFIDSIEPVTEDLRDGQKISMSRREVLRKTGELFALRHLINLSSDLLDTPDFYWDRAVLEPLYMAVYNHLDIARRTKVMNEKLSHCCELTELLSSHLNDAHHTRLEVMIIVLILVEVVFEIVHYIERYVSDRQHVEPPHPPSAFHENC
ncbi:hypothetical protein ACOMHN_014875 [Nucella lapillus]